MAAIMWRSFEQNSAAARIMRTAARRAATGMLPDSLYPLIQLQLAEITGFVRESQ